MNTLVSALFFETEDGAKIYYEDHGKGDVILLVHGWMCSSKFWRANVPELAKGFRVVTIDKRGHGYSSKTLEDPAVDRAGDLFGFHPARLHWGSAKGKRTRNRVRSGFERVQERNRAGTVGGGSIAERKIRPL